MEAAAIVTDRVGQGSSFAPGLGDRPLAYETFRRIVVEGAGSGRSVMQGYAGDNYIEPFVDDTHRYLLARADGALGRGRPGRSAE